MLHFYQLDRMVCGSALVLALPACPPPQPGQPLVWLYDEPLTHGRSSFLVSDPRQLFAKGLALLDENALPPLPEPLPPCIPAAIAAGTLRAVNIAHPDWHSGLTPTYPRRKLRVNILAMGDVGGTLLTGLHLLGADVIESIGIFDMKAENALRWEFEVNQIAYPEQLNALPPVEIIERKDLFKCDVFVFVASRGVPQVGSQVADVRMAQLALNRVIVEDYARQARQERFQGLFAEVSDPVDPLAKYAYLASNTDENGVFDGKGLPAERVQGYGLGVMNARAAYYARKEERFAAYLTEGRAYGPHGQDLVIANSLAHYDDALSRELTAKVVQANKDLRAVGFKPYVAPAMSSGALSLLLTLRGEWHYGSVYLDGVFMGVKNRYTPYGQQTELAALPAALSERIAAAAANLAAIE